LIVAAAANARVVVLAAAEDELDVGALASAGVVILRKPASCETLLAALQEDRPLRVA